MHSAGVVFWLLILWSLVRFLAFPKIYSNIAEIYQWSWLEESGQRLENVDLDLA